MNLRNTAFNVLSLLRHRSVPAHIETLKRAEEDADFYRRTKVSSIEQLKRDLAKVPFYKRYQDASFPYDYPVMTKSFIQEHIIIAETKRPKKRKRNVHFLGRGEETNAKTKRPQRCVRTHRGYSRSSTAVRELIGRRSNSYREKSGDQ